MQKKGNQLQFSATDLASYLGCRHKSQLEIAAQAKVWERPMRTNRVVEDLKKKGLKFEDDYVAYLKENKMGVVNLRDYEGEDFRERTIEAMKAGADIIVQAVLGNNLWQGKADFLFKVDCQSDLGDWSYEVADTKLSRETKGGAILQLCIYNHLLTPILGDAHLPEYMHVIKPSSTTDSENRFEKNSYRLDDYQAYFRLIKSNFEQAMALAAQMDFDALAQGEAAQVDTVAKQETATLKETSAQEEPASEGKPKASDLMQGLQSKPEPVLHCDICAWWPECDSRRRKDDHLSFIAGIRSNQIEELRDHGLNTLTAFVERGEASIPQLKGNQQGFWKLHRQASLQHESFLKNAKPPLYEYLEVEEKRGFNFLPEATAGDIFFDLEGDHFAEDGPQEYLFGYCYFDEQVSEQGGSSDTPGLVYTSIWIHNRREEQLAYEQFIDFLYARIKCYPDLRVYHFAPYETGALKRMVGRYGSKTVELDSILRAKRFVDLLTVVRQSLVAGIERYSIKELEQFYGYERMQDLSEVKLSRWEVESSIASNQSFSEQHREIVERYNEDDCRSTFHLRNWLEAQREIVAADHEREGAELIRPELAEGEAKEEISKADEKRARIFEALTKDLPGQRDDWSEIHKAKNLLAHLLGFFKREGNVAWWEHFRLMELEPEEQLRERKVIAGLEPVRGFMAEDPTVVKYRFPKQEVAISAGKGLIQVSGGVINEKNEYPGIGSLVEMDLNSCTVTIKRIKRDLAVHPQVVVQSEVVTTKALEESLFGFAESVIANGVDDNEAASAGLDLLMGRPPRLEALTSMEEQPSDTTAYLKSLALGLDNSLLAVQGPPGTGKTYNGAHMILALAKAGKRIGVTAVSHKVVNNLLGKVGELAAELNQEIKLAHKQEENIEGIESFKKPEHAVSKLNDGCVVGGTAWLWASEKFGEKVDYLFVDEAGQMSLAYVLAASRACKNIILLGDPQQLQQPQRGEHPEGAEVSALLHVLGEQQTIPWQKGVFLDTTYRLHPDICQFNSELYYENRLTALQKLSHQRLSGSHDFKGSGLFYVPVEHESNQSSSPEEVTVIAQIVEQLLASDSKYIDERQGVRKLTSEHIKIIAPYNMQVAALQAKIKEVQIGTVDKFQGQEAPVVIYSMASSSADDAPRGMSFLYDPHRLNVASSRARATFILVGSPALKFPDCKTPEQMKWANGLCRFFELAKTIEGVFVSEKPASKISE